MPDTLSKLRPDRDLQCYFQEPSAIAALSNTSQTGFTVSGCWREQFDWAVVEWNRDNVIDHPALRNLPDGDLSGVHLSYEEVRTNCIPLDSTTYDSIGWSYLRVWEWSNNQETLHLVPLKPCAAPVGGSYVPATIQFELKGTLTSGDYVEISWLDQHANYQVTNSDSLESVVQGLAGFINAAGDASGVTATASGAQITLTCVSAVGTNGNRIGVYGGVHGAGTESWSPASGYFSGGSSPQRWRVDLDFANLTDTNQQRVTTTNVRKLRWTWAADWQAQSYVRSEFAVQIDNWQVSGSNLAYQVAGPGSRRLEDSSSTISYTGDWVAETGNYSNGSIRHATQSGSALTCSYLASTPHTLLLGSRYTDNGGKIQVQVDGGPPQVMDLKRSLEDVLVRIPLGQFGGQTQHTVNVTHCGADNTDVYFDFLELAVPTASLPIFGTNPTMTLATDWDTYHSLAIAPERTAWEIETLGFKGRANHYAGAMWFYELVDTGNQYATTSITFAGTPLFGGTTTLTVSNTSIQHLNLIGDTAERIAKCFEFLLAAGSSVVWAQANGTTLSVTARVTGSAGNFVTIGATTNNDLFTATVNASALSGGVDGRWTTDLAAVPRLNRAARDWTRSYLQALKNYGIDATVSFSMELRHGDDSPATGIAQRYPQGPVWLDTPALQTNFGPSSLAFWQQAHADMAEVMTEAGMQPYLQFGEVQWWYFADNSGMPFYDAYTLSRFQAEHGRALAIIPSQNADPTAYPDECVFLPKLIGEFTNAVMTFVRQKYSNARFEVLYPPDTNDTPLNQIINYPANDWIPSIIDCLKTENFTYTGNRDLNKARESINLPAKSGFGATQRSHLVGIGDYTSPWRKENDLALAAGMESVVLFALDQFCLIGYELPLKRGNRRATYMGA
jgi:hypothetical protein